MFRQIVKVAVVVSLISASVSLQAKPYTDKERRQLEKILRAVDTSAIQTQLLLRRMEVRNVSARTAMKWVYKLSEIHGRNLPVHVVIDRLQQGLIKEVPINSISHSLTSLFRNLNWSFDILSRKLFAQQRSRLAAGSGSATVLRLALDDDDKNALDTTITNLEIALRQGHQRRPLETIITRYSNNLQDAAKLSGIITIWTNYGVSYAQVLFNLSRGLRVGMSVEDMEDIYESVDSLVVSEKMTSPGDITRLISAKVRAELEKIEAEQSFRNQMRGGVYQSGTAEGGSSSTDSGISGGGTTATSGSSTSSGATNSGTTSSGTTGDGTTGSGTTGDGTTSDGTTGDGGTMGGGGSHGGGMMDGGGGMR